MRCSGSLTCAVPAALLLLLLLLLQGSSLPPDARASRQPLLSCCCIALGAGGQRCPCLLFGCQLRGLELQPPAA
jgi:hypothetical protein